MHNDHVPPSDMNESLNEVFNIIEEDIDNIKIDILNTIDTNKNTLKSKIVDHIFKLLNNEKRIVSNENNEDRIKELENELEDLKNRNEYLVNYNTKLYSELEKFKQNIQEDTLKDTIYKGTIRNTYEDVSKDSFKDSLKNASKDTSKDLIDKNKNTYNDNLYKELYDNATNINKDKLNIDDEKLESHPISDLLEELFHTEDKYDFNKSLNRFINLLGDENNTLKLKNIHLPMKEIVRLNKYTIAVKESTIINYLNRKPYSNEKMYINGILYKAYSIEYFSDMTSRRTRYVIFLVTV